MLNFQTKDSLLISDNNENSNKHETKKQDKNENNEDSSKQDTKEEEKNEDKWPR